MLKTVLYGFNIIYYVKNRTVLEVLKRYFKVVFYFVFISSSSSKTPRKSLLLSSVFHTVTQSQSLSHPRVCWPLLISDYTASHWIYYSTFFWLLPSAMPRIVLKYNIMSFLTEKLWIASDHLNKTQTYYVLEIHWCQPHVDLQLTPLLYSIFTLYSYNLKESNKPKNLEYGTTKDPE